MARFALGLAEASFFPGIIVHLTHWFLQKERARAVGVFMSALAVANIIQSPIYGWLLTQNWLGLAGWRWVFITEGIPVVLWGLAVLYLMPDWPREAKWLTPEEKAWLEGELAKEMALHLPERIDWRAGFKYLGPWLLAAIYFFAVTGLYGITIWSPTVIKALTGGNLVQVGILNGVLYAFALLAMIAVGRSSDRHKERFLHVAIPLLIAAAAYTSIGATASWPTIAFILLIIAAMGQYGFSSGPSGLYNRGC